MLTLLNTILQTKDLTNQKLIHCLHKIFQGHACIEHYKVMKELLNCKMEDLAKVRTHTLKMIKLIERTKSFGSHMLDGLAIDLVVSSLPRSYIKFVKEFYKD